MVDANISNMSQTPEPPLQKIAPPKKGKAKTILFLILLTVIILGLMGGYFRWRSGYFDPLLARTKKTLENFWISIKGPSAATSPERPVTIP